MERFIGRDPDGSRIELAVYGRDAADARALAYPWLRSNGKLSTPLPPEGQISDAVDKGYGQER